MQLPDIINAITFNSVKTRRENNAQMGDHFLKNGDLWYNGTIRFIAIAISGVKAIESSAQINTSQENNCKTISISR